MEGEPDVREEGGTVTISARGVTARFTGAKVTREEQVMRVVLPAR
jgi:hypothetical protein